MQGLRSEVFFRGRALISRGSREPSRRRRLVLWELLRLMVETIFVLILLLLIIAVTSQFEGADVVSLLGLYAYAGFRFVPSANRITLNLNNMEIGVPFVRELCDDIATLDVPAD